MTTDIKPNLSGDLVTRLNWFDDFSGDLSLWNQEGLIESGDHRTGNKFIQPDGTVDLDKPWHKLPARYEGLCDEYRDKCQFIEDGNLVIKGYAINEPNPYRINFTDSYGVVHPYGDWRIWGAWLESLRTVTKGSVTEFRVNLEAQSMRNHRFSFWFVSDNGKMYGKTVEHCEIDLLEAQNDSRVFGSDFAHKGLMKIVGGPAGDTPDGKVDFNDFDIDIRKGWHTFTLVWNLDGTLEFYCDGIRCNSDSRYVGMEARIIISDEMCNGVKELEEGADPLPWENYSTDPKIPANDGLTAQSVILDVDQMDDHKVLVDYVAVWDIVEGKQAEETETESKTDPVMQAFQDVRSAMDKLEGLLKS